MAITIIVIYVSTVPMEQMGMEFTSLSRLLQCNVVRFFFPERR